MQNVLSFSLVQPIQQTCQEVYGSVCELAANEPDHDDHIYKTESNERCTDFMGVTEGFPTCYAVSCARSPLECSGEHLIPGFVSSVTYSESHHG